MALENGVTLPEMVGIGPDGDETPVGGLVTGSWGVVLLYRGHW